MKNSLFLVLFIFVCNLSLYAYKKNVNTFALNNVRLSESKFKDAQQLDYCYILGLDPDRLMAPYLKEAGLTPKAENYTNWENTGLDGHIGGHYISALSYMYASTASDEINARLDYVLSELKLCQDKSGDGYISGVPGGKAMWSDIKNGKIKSGNFDLNGKWVPLYNIHKLYAGLRDAYLIAGKKEAKGMLIDLTDWMYDLTKGLSDEDIQKMLKSEHGGLNEVFADVYYITGDKKYLDMAKRFSHNLLLEPLIKKEDKLTGMHANTQIPKVIGFKRIADLDALESWNEASEFFWETVVNNRTVSIGGNSVREHFHPSNNFTSMIESEQGPETCNTYNMLRLSKLLYESTGDVRYIDYYERALYNHILTSIHPKQGGFVYFTPMRPGHYRVYSQPQLSFWCCVGSGLENHARYGEMIYAYRNDELIVNLFIPSTLDWKENKLKIIQETSFPMEDSTRLVFSMKKPKTMKVTIRRPKWLGKEFSVYVNGKSVEYSEENGYISIYKKWNNGDVLTFRMPMHIYTEQLPDGSPYYSFNYGPLVLANKMGNNDMKGLFADDSRGGHIADGIKIPLDEIPFIKKSSASLDDMVLRPDNNKLEFLLKKGFTNADKDISLVPFYEAYGSRYVIYWRVNNTDEQTDNLLKQEEIRYVDMVVCGEQQPESDHFIKMNDSEIGYTDGKHWRDTKEMFSYKMKTYGKNVTNIIINYIPDDRCNAIVYINNKKCGIINGKDGVFKGLVPSEIAKGSDFEVAIKRYKSLRTVKVTSVMLVE